MNSNDRKIMMIRNEKIPKVLLKLGIPTMIGMMVSALYSVVDAYFVGWLGISQMGAVSIVFPIVQIIVGLGMTFGSGAASYIARLLGEGKSSQANKTASTALFSSLFVGAALIVISMCFLDNILVALGATETILPYANEYAVIYVIASILSIFNITMNNIITAEGRTKLTMLAMLIGCGLNVILDPILILVLGFGVQGAAIATVISQLATACMYLCFILGKKGYLDFSFRLFVFDKKIYGEIFKVGVPIFLFQLLSSIAMSLSNTAAGEYGDSAIAAVGVVTRLMTLGTYVIFGYMKGFQPVVGYNFGSKCYNRVKEATRFSLIWATIFCVVVGLLLIVIPEQIISRFSENDAAFIDIGVRALRANGILFSLYGFQMVYMSLFLALGNGKEGGLLSISRQGLFFIPAILIMPSLFGLEGIIWAQPVADFLTIILTAILAIGINKKINALEKKSVLLLKSDDIQEEYINAV